MMVTLGKSCRRSLVMDPALRVEVYPLTTKPIVPFLISCHSIYYMDIHRIRGYTSHILTIYMFDIFLLVVFFAGKKKHTIWINTGNG